MITDNIAMCVTRLSIVDWVNSKTQILLATFEDSESTSGKILCNFGSRTIVPVNWMCKKQTSVSQRLTGYVVISLDAGLRMGGLPALDLWDLVLEVLHSPFDVPARRNPLQEEVQSKYTSTNTKTRRHGNQDNDDLSNVDHVITSAKPCHFEAMLYIFEDNEAVIKIIIKG